LAPLAGSVTWRAPSSASLGEGLAVVAAVGEDSRAESEARRVRAALTGKPNQSRWLAAGESLALYELRGRRLELTWFCLSRVGPREPCSVSLELDGRPLVCPEPAAATSTPGVALPRRCRVNVPKDAR